MTYIIILLCKLITALKKYQFIIMKQFRIMYYIMNTEKREKKEGRY